MRPCPSHTPLTSPPPSFSTGASVWESPDMNPASCLLARRWATWPSPLLSPTVMPSTFRDARRTVTCRARSPVAVVVAVAVLVAVAAVAVMVGNDVR